MDQKKAQQLYDKYKGIYEEKDAENKLNGQQYFLNSLEIVQKERFDENSYEVILNVIKDGKLIKFKLDDAIRLFINMK